MTDARRAAQAWLEIYDATGYAGEACAAQLIRALLAAQPPRPAQDAVREAAERLRATLDRTCGKYLGGPRLPLVNDLEEHAARLLAAIDAAKGGE